MSSVSVTKKNPDSLFKSISKFPWMFAVIGFLFLADRFGWPLDNTVYGYAFITMAVVVLFVEMVKSVDVSPMGFLMDLIWAVIAVILSTALLTYMYFSPDKEIGFFHWLGYGIILADAILNPFNSFRSALRNFDVGS
ncbi:MULTISPECIES: hypothetical protein [Thiomicrorhabdus]|uniref:SPW repeat-containing protein n=1 Tax=Thiomicrorhabdus heinhorstiae TaxID=2748010 RepID=A0ABS0BYE8_9GAMM|nr:MULTISPECIES: hypothetical protein [Thiomicrorhabdus]MBF6058804.1 hypothetical protein [Thiomicrorhabdus heinhorstiae]